MAKDFLRIDRKRDILKDLSEKEETCIISFLEGIEEVMDKGKVQIDNYFVVDSGEDKLKKSLKFVKGIGNSRIKDILFYIMSKDYKNSLKNIEYLGLYTREGELAVEPSSLLQTTWNHKNPAFRWEYRQWPVKTFKALITFLSQSSGSDDLEFLREKLGEVSASLLEIEECSKNPNLSIPAKEYLRDHLAEISLTMDEISKCYKDD